MKMRVSGCHRNEGKPVNMWRHNLRSHLAAAATLGVALRQRKGPGIWSIARPVLRRRRRHHDYPRIHAAGQRLLQWLRRRCNGERVRKTVRALECERFVCVRHFWLDNPSRFVTMLRLKLIGHLIRFRTQSAAPQKRTLLLLLLCVLFLSIVARSHRLASLSVSFFRTSESCY